MNHRKRFLFLVIASLVVGGVVGEQLAQDSRNGESDKIQLPEDTLPKEIDLKSVPVGFTDLPNSPEHNAVTSEKVQLGRRLFFDPILSADRTVSCASCHQPEAAFASTDAVAVGINQKKGERNAPSLMNVGYRESLFWDGRASTLEEQALMPISNESELGNTIEKVVSDLKADKTYVAQFAQAFGESSNDGSDSTDANETEANGENISDSYITPQNLAKAIASFERTLFSGNSRVDRFRAAEYEALSKTARQGMWIFESRGGCWQCHSGPNLADELFHNTGVSFEKSERDLGRAKFTKKKGDNFKFKTPTLRNVAQSAPYMHDGSIKTLKEVVEFYNRGGAPKDPLLDEKMKPLKLTEEEVEFLVEFLKALSDSD